MDQAREQSGDESFYRRRKPEGSRMDPNRTLAEQFELLRVVDNERYPAFFEWRGSMYDLRIRKVQ
jgi:methionyl-tRNA formyltransferase